MRKILEMILCILTSALTSIWIMTYVLKETEVVRFIAGEILIALLIYIILILLFSVAEAREERRRKQNEKNRKHSIKTTVK